MSILIYTVVAFILGMGVGQFMLKKETKIKKSQRVIAVSMVGIQIAATSFILLMIDQMFHLNIIIELLISVVVCIAMALTLRASVVAYINKAKA